MCLALPARVLERDAAGRGVVDLNGVRMPVSLALVPDAEAGDYVIVHVRFAIGRVDAEEAERTLRVFAELSSGPAAEAPDGGLA